MLGWIIFLVVLSAVSMALVGLMLREPSRDSHAGRAAPRPPADAPDSSPPPVAPAPPEQAALGEPTTSLR